MIRILGAVCIFTASTLLGIYFSENIRHKKERLLSEEKMFMEIYNLIRWKSLTMHEIIECLSKSNQFTDFEFITHLSENCIQTRSFPTAWKNAVKSDRHMSSEEKSLFFEIGNSLGTTDTDGQLSVLEMYKSEIEKMIVVEGEKYKVKGKLYRSLGVSFGAMTGILII